MEAKLEVFKNQKEKAKAIEKIDSKLRELESKQLKHQREFAKLIVRLNPEMGGRCDPKTVWDELALENSTALVSELADVPAMAKSAGGGKKLLKRFKSDPDVKKNFPLEFQKTVELFLNEEPKLSAMIKKLQEIIAQRAALNQHKARLSEAEIREKSEENPRKRESKERSFVKDEQRKKNPKEAKPSKSKARTLEQLERRRAELMDELLSELPVSEDRMLIEAIGSRVVVSPEVLARTTLSLVKDLRAGKVRADSPEEKRAVARLTQNVDRLDKSVQELQRINEEIAHWGPSSSSTELPISKTPHRDEYMAESALERCATLLVKIRRTGFGPGDVQMNAFLEEKAQEMIACAEGRRPISRLLLELHETLKTLESNQLKLIRKSQAHFAKDKGDKSKVKKAAQILDALIHTPVAERGAIMTAPDSHPVKKALAAPRHGPNKHRFFNSATNSIEKKKAAKAYTEILKKLEHDEPATAKIR